MLQTTTSKRFCVLRRLGEGGTGEVYQATGGDRAAVAARKKPPELPR